MIKRLTSSIFRPLQSQSRLEPHLAPADVESCATLEIMTTEEETATSEHAFILAPHNDSIIRYFALLLNLKIPLFDAVPEVLDYGGSQLHLVGEGGEALAYKARPFE